MTIARPHGGAARYAYGSAVAPMRGTLAATPRQEQRT